MCEGLSVCTRGLVYFSLDYSFVCTWRSTVVETAVERKTRALQEETAENGRFRFYLVF